MYGTIVKDFPVNVGEDEIKVNLEVVVTCSDCGREFKFDYTIKSWNGEHALMITIPLCEDCSNEIREQGLAEGRAIGFEDGRESAQTE